MSSRLTFGTLKRIVAILIAIAIVLAAGIVVGQAPAIFGVEEDLDASITFADQQGDGTAVTVREVSLSDGGYVVLTDGGDGPLAVSEHLEAGTHENVTIEREDDATHELVGELTATVHRDTGDDPFAYYETDGEEDHPYLEDGFPVSDTATVTTTEEDALSDSFVVESIDAPAAATTNETIRVNATLRNPTAFQTQQSVTVRIDGAVFEQRVLELEGGESRRVTFETDTSGAPPGNRTIGVYTDGDGAVAGIELAFHTEPSVSVADASAERVTVEAAIPERGFVALERNGTAIGTSTRLEPGDHENVTVDLPEDAAINESDELTAALYAGDPGDADSASPIEVDDRPVRTTFTIGDAADAESGDDSDGDGSGSDSAAE
ncbi:DUF7282 domain-containing protein [Natrinema altunense]|uniref:DUF4179 domain-containing protein n=1 Tax=Natrinema altunense (strain JCM 12890 / CGMCC 1.3731 / AJ2) TaxID=1227494 RepID=L9ZER7_NATA2|nr:CARDB domain-containing protein [Natrinema altunense]ELY84955.1 hypothetical protein C485_13340 [Natrinema altunense JCM 12890]